MKLEPLYSGGFIMVRYGKELCRDIQGSGWTLLPHLYGQVLVKTSDWPTESEALFDACLGTHRGEVMHRS